MKNGTIFTSKYESDQFMTPHPHIFIFSNSLPTKPKAISDDRWQISRISQKHKELVGMGEQEVIDYMKDFALYEIRKTIKTNNNRKETFAKLRLWLQIF
jgi:hypothetical protein